jgi:hypothetical protein
MGQVLNAKAGFRKARFAELVISRISGYFHGNVAPVLSPRTPASSVNEAP